ncbi:MAG: hypothetical protein AB7U98_03315 [Candidatus Nitrosocosmicus sp.]
MIIGLVLSFSGGSWDITFHILSQPESFFSYPHSLVYSGILLVISIFAVNFRKNFSEEKTIKKNNIIIFTGIILILTAGPFDFSWHLKFGLDGLLSPPHLTLLTGWLLIAIGNLRITNMRVNQTKIQDNERRSHKPDSYNLYHDRTFVAKGRTAINQESNKIQNEMQRTSKLESLGRISFYQIQLFLNLSILLMIISGFLYFFSLPFSETLSYNFNPPPFLALLVYGLGFPILFSGYFLKILSKYPDIRTMVPLVGTFYIIMTSVTQISSNSYLSGYTGYYLLNLIPFLLFYVVYRYCYHSNLANSEKSQNSLYNKKDLFSARNSKYALWGIIFALLSYSLCFPLNTYIYNEEIYGYLIYQNLVVEVYQMVFSENFVIILAMSAIGGYIGYLLSQPRSIPLRSKI